MKKLPKILLIAALILFSVGATFYITYTELTRQHALELQTITPVEQKTAEISDYLGEYFIDEYDEQVLADAAAAAMVEATGDEWSYYLTADEYAMYLESFYNAYVGIGVTITADEEAGGMRIESVVPNGPADRSGVLVGDILLQVEGQDTLTLGVTGTRDLVRGEEGTAVNMLFSRDGEKLELTIVRESIDTEVASCELLDGEIGYIRINNFDVRCADETIACINEMRNAGAKALLFDVRFNGGGLKDEMVEVLDHLLPEGVLFRSVDYAGEKEVDYSDKRCIKLPMAVLVNLDSYSAAEFFAAALQEYGWATVVGEQTYGKGNFQTSFELSDGSMLNISIGKYYTPEGKSLTGVGITPDIVCELSDEDYADLYYGVLEKEDDEQLQQALDALRQKIS